MNWPDKPPTKIEKQSLLSFIEAKQLISLIFFFPKGLLRDRSKDKSLKAKIAFSHHSK